MMGKITKGGGFKGLINYLLDPKKGAEVLDFDGIRTKNRDSMLHSFACQARLRPSLSKCVGHISLSFSAEDQAKMKISDQLMLQIAKEYMRKMGIRDTQYLIVKHQDREHPHIHLLYNRVDNLGKTISDRNEKYRNCEVCRALTQSYDLHIANGKDHVKTHRLNDPDKTKYEIYDALRELLPKSRNWRQLVELLKPKGITTLCKTNGNTAEVFD